MERGKGGHGSVLDAILGTRKLQQMEQQEPASMLPENHPRFLNEAGDVDYDARMRYLSEMGQTVSADDKPRASYYERELANFINARLDEANMAKELHAWRDNLPWNQQPHWLFEMWQAYWSGEAKGIHDKHPPK